MFTCHSYPTTPLGLDPFTSWLRKLMSYLIGLLSLLGLFRAELTMLQSPQSFLQYTCMIFIYLQPLITTLNKQNKVQNSFSSH